MPIPSCLKLFLLCTSRIVTADQMVRNTQNMCYLLLYRKVCWPLTQTFVSSRALLYKLSPLAAECIFVKNILNVDTHEKDMGWYVEG